MRETQILPTRSVTADMISRIGRIAPLPVPAIPSDAEALNDVCEMGEFDQLKLKRFKRREVEAMRAEGFTWDDSVKGWVR